MVGCDNEERPIQWFHLCCINFTMEQLPLGETGSVQNIVNIMLCVMF